MSSEPTVPSGLAPVSINKRRIRIRPLSLLLLPIIAIALVMLFASQSEANQIDEDDGIADVIVYRSETLNTNISENASQPQAAPPTRTPIFIAANPTAIPVTGTYTPATHVDETIDLCRVRSAVSEQNVIVRAGPGQDYDTVAVLYPGRSIELSAQDNTGWYQVILPSGGVGWVANNVVRREGDCEGLHRYDLPICTISNAIDSNANIRSAPNLEGQIVDALPADGIRLADMRTDDGWYRLQLASRTGWISAQVITLEGDCDALPFLPEESDISLDMEEVAAEDTCLVRSFTGDPVNLRAEPDMNAEITGQLTDVQPSSRRSDNGWFEVTDQGWAFAADLRFDGPCSQLPTEK